MKIQKITEFKTNKWSGGTTTELFIYPKDGDYAQRDFIFRLSSATVDLEKSIFSNLEGFKRFIAPLEGTLNISHDERNFKSLAINELYSFDGGIKTVSSGKCRDFNFMLKDGYEGFANHKELSPNNRLTIDCKGTEIIWIFSYHNEAKIQINISDKTVKTIDLTPMMISVFILEEKDSSPIAIHISANQSVDLFYGKVSLR